MPRGTLSSTLLIDILSMILPSTAIHNKGCGSFMIINKL